jgi:peptide/nickel transport system substrate-binding protein
VGLVVGAALLLAAAATPHGSKEGGTFRVATFALGPIDPALAPGLLADTTCGTLVGFPDKPLPAGFTLVPDLAEASPAVSGDGRTYTFTVRKDARFSNGTPVTARAFSHALERIFTPAMNSVYSTVFERVVGAQEMLDGKANSLSGVVAKGRMLSVRLTKPTSDFLLRLSNLCAVPPNLPVDPEGARAPLPSAAPYYAAQYVPGERAVLERNRYYRGQRPHHVDRFIFTQSVGVSIVDQVMQGKADFAGTSATESSERSAELGRRYGVNRSQFWVQPGIGLRLLVLNTSGPLFRKNPKLRQAVNFAIDRRALTRELGAFAGRATDQYLIPGAPGFRDERIYPLTGPDLAKAKALAKGHLRSGRAVLYTPSPALPTAVAQIARENLKAIGLDVEIKQFPPPVAFARMATRGEPFDIGYVGWFDVRDPSLFLPWMFDGRTIADAPDFGNWSYFDSPKYNRLFDEASRLTGAQRNRAFGDLDVQLSREPAPAIPYAAINATAFVSSRVGCVVMNPRLDLTAVCLK